MVLLPSQPLVRRLVGGALQIPDTSASRLACHLCSNRPFVTHSTSPADRLVYLCDCIWGPVDHQQSCFKSLPKRSRYRGPACCTTTWPDMYDTHTGRLIQVTVCELDRMLSFGPSPRASGPPTGPRSSRGEGLGLHTTRHDTTRHDNDAFDSGLEARPWPHQSWPHFPARVLAPYLTSAEMNMGPSAIIHAWAAGLFHPNQPLHTLLRFRARTFNSTDWARNQISPISPSSTTRREGNLQLQPRLPRPRAGSQAITKFPHSGRTPTSACLLFASACTCIGSPAS